MLHKNLEQGAQSKTYSKGLFTSTAITALSALMVMTVAPAAHAQVVVDLITLGLTTKAQR